MKQGGNFYVTLEGKIAEKLMENSKIFDKKLAEKIFFENFLELIKIFFWRKTSQKPKKIFGIK